jgi:hypothetical protein
MTTRLFLAGSTFALGLAAAASGVSAHGVGSFVCQTFSTAKNAPPATHCVTWTREARAMMKAAPCDPAKMSATEMRRHCAEMSARAAPAVAPDQG